jgi:hypothetical protein
VSPAIIGALFPSSAIRYNGDWSERPLPVSARQAILSAPWAQVAGALTGFVGSDGLKKNCAGRQEGVTSSSATRYRLPDNKKSIEALGHGRTMGRVHSCAEVASLDDLDPPERGEAAFPRWVRKKASWKQWAGGDPWTLGDCREPYEPARLPWRTGDRAGRKAELLMGQVLM